MKKLLIALALAATLVTTTAGAWAYLGAHWSTPKSVGWVRGTSVRDTTSFAFADTVRTDKIDLTGMDWSQFFGESSAGAYVARPALIVTVGCYGIPVGAASGVSAVARKGRRSVPRERA
jgi:hypothetical protein